LASAGRGLDARDTLTLALSHKGRGDLSLAIHTWLRVANLAATVWIPAFAGMTGAKWLAVGWARRLAAAGRGLDARDTLTLALSHKGRGDLSLAIHTWFRVANLAATIWIPAFAGMTGAKEKGSAGWYSRLVSDSGLGRPPLDSRFRGNHGR